MGIMGTHTCPCEEVDSGRRITMFCDVIGIDVPSHFILSFFRFRRRGIKVAG
jgi:hypothetical protein